MSEKVLRIGSVPYLNARVLTYGLAEQRGVSLEFHPPSSLARLLASGAIDVALASSIEYLRHHEYGAVPGLSISGRSEMWSIRLLHRIPLTDLRTVALDPASETTNSLLRVLLKEKYGLEPDYVSPQSRLDRGTSAESAEVDAFLLIGDPAMTFQRPGWEAWDLLSAWHALTGLPFVFALWMTRPGLDLESLGARLRRCRDEGLQHARDIAAREADSYGLTRERTLQFITQVVRYDWGEEEQTGLRRFQQYLLKFQLLPAPRPGL